MSKKRFNSVKTIAKLRQIEVQLEFLLNLLSQGPCSARTIYDDARSAGIALPTLRRAKASLGIRPHKMGMADGWA
jgi:hypothetical protein